MSYIGHITAADEFEIYIIPTNAALDTHKVKLKFKDESMAKDVITKAKKLKDLPSEKIFIKYDEPYFT